MRFNDISPRQKLAENVGLVKAGLALLGWLKRLGSGVKNGSQFVDDAVRAADEGDEALLNYLVKHKIINKGDKVDDLSEFKRLLNTVKREEITMAPGDEINHARRLYQINQRLKAQARAQKQADDAVASGTKKTGPNVRKQRVNQELDDLAKNNGITDPNKIQAGQKIKLPDGSEYTIQSGDTLGGILRKYKNSRQLGRSLNKEREEMDKLFGGDLADQLLASENARKILAQIEAENPSLLKRVGNFLKKDAGKDAGTAWRDTKRGLKTFGALGLLLFLNQCKEEQDRTGETDLSPELLGKFADRVTGFLTSKTEEEIEEIQSAVEENPETIDNLTFIGSVEDYRKFTGEDPPEDSPLWNQDQSRNADGIENRLTDPRNQQADTVDDTEGDGKEADIGTDANVTPGSDSVASTDDQAPTRPDLTEPERRDQEPPVGKPDAGEVNIDPSIEEPNIEKPDVKPVEPDSQEVIDARNKKREEEQKKKEEELRKKLEQEKEEERVRKEAERKAREEQARREAEAEAEREAEAEAEREAERKAREERARQAERDAERKAREEQARRKAEAEARRKAEEARRKAEAEAERKAREEQARREAEAEAEREAEAEAEEERRRREADQAGGGTGGADIGDEVGSGGKGGDGTGQDAGSGTGGADVGGGDGTDSGYDPKPPAGASVEEYLRWKERQKNRKGKQQYHRESREYFIAEEKYSREQYVKWVRKYAKLYDVPFELALHVLNRETGHISDADKAAKVESPKGAVGVMQIMPNTGKELGLSTADLNNPNKNIEAGVRYLAQQYNKFNQNSVHALAAYNWGPEATRKWLARGGKGKLPKETHEYIYGSKSKQKNWAPYKGDLNTQLTNYLGKDLAQAYIEPDTVGVDTQIRDKEEQTTNQTSDDNRSIRNDQGGIAMDVVTDRVTDYLKDKWNQFKRDAMAKTAGTDPAVLSGAGDTDELPDATEPRSPGKPPEVKGGPIWDKTKEIVGKAVDTVTDLPGKVKDAADATVDAVAPPEGMEDYGLDSSGKTKWDREIEKDPNLVKEETPPGDKYERMVKHIKKGYKKDGKLTKREKSIAYATAWKLYNQRKKKKS